MDKTGDTRCIAEEKAPVICAYRRHSLPSHRSFCAPEEVRSFNWISEFVVDFFHGFRAAGALISASCAFIYAI